MRRLRFLTGRHRSPSTNAAVGLLLAFHGGALDAGRLLVPVSYTPLTLQATRD